MLKRRLRRAFEVAMQIRQAIERIERQGWPGIYLETNDPRDKLVDCKNYQVEYTN